MKKIFFSINLLFVLVVFLILDACKKDNAPAWNASCQGEYQKLDESKTLHKICFGSCASQLSPLPLLSVAANQKPDLFIFLGDNIYADTEDMNVMREKYVVQCEKSDFINLKATTPILAVWDDHDFGYNDVGSEYQYKEESKQNFMQFWDETDNTDRMAHPGIYDAKIIGEAGKRVQIIMLDTRTFRTKLKTSSPLFYIENTSPEATMLGAAQWAWLETQLLKDADIRIIVSSVQFGTDYNASEAWALFPLEKTKMIDLIESTNANGAFFLSGDVHYAELTKKEPTNTYPLYDFTSSGITGKSEPETNAYRVGNASSENNIGQIDIDWNGAATNITFSIRNANAELMLEENILLSELQF